MRLVFLSPLVLAATACASASGFNRSELRRDIADPAAAVVTEDDIQRALDARPQLPSPFRLAVHFVDVAPNPLPRGGTTPQWPLADRTRLVAALGELRRPGVVSDVVLLEPGSIEGGDVKAMRLAAARAGADAVLVVRAVGQTDRYNNALGFTYIGVVTTAFVPATQVDALFLAGASLWDVRNQYLYLSSQVEGAASQTRPALWASDRTALAEARADALDSLAEDLVTRLASMR